MGASSVRLRATFLHSMDARRRCPSIDESHASVDYRAATRITFHRCSTSIDDGRAIDSGTFEFIRHSHPELTLDTAGSTMPQS
jgi:hypothetical protein